MSPDQNYFDELFRISRNQIIWGGNYFIDKIIRPSQCWLIWNKGQRGFSLADGEMAWTSFDRAVRIFDYSRATALNENRKNGGMFHPTKKPVALYIWILENYASKGDKIFDSHMGSGSIGIACHDMGFDLDACEIDIDYFQLAKERIENHQQQIQLFGAL